MTQLPATKIDLYSRRNSDRTAVGRVREKLSARRIGDDLPQTSPAKSMESQIRITLQGSMRARAAVLTSPETSPAISRMEGPLGMV